jgi:hypothetical protein
MNSTMVHQYNRSVVEDGIAATSTGYLPSSSGSASVGPGIAYDHRVAVDTLGTTQHSLGPNVSLPYQCRPTNIVRIPLSPADICAWAVARLRRHLQQSHPVHRRPTPPRGYKFYLLPNLRRKCACPAGLRRGKSWIIKLQSYGRIFSPRCGLGFCTSRATPDG